MSTVFRLGDSSPSHPSPRPALSVKQKPRFTTVPTLGQRLSSQPSLLPVYKPVQTVRIRGRQLQDIRKRHFQKNPLCVECQKLGKVRAATQVDHRKPLWDGGTDTEDNRQGLCDQCHDRKTASEAALRGMMR